LITVGQTVDVFPVGSYCNQYVDRDALMYLILANEILHVQHPNIITIAEDVSYTSLFFGHAFV